jgi:diguanylate cyclase (GGDEF)-like protein
MSRAGSNQVTVNFSMEWLFAPPFVAIITVIVTGLFSTGVVVPVDPAIWGLVGLMFVFLTVLYMIFVKQDFSRGLFAVQLIAQGILLCPLSLRMGAQMFQWIGVVLASCGAVLLVEMYRRSRVDRDQPAPYVMPQLELDTLPLPFVITDNKGYMISASDLLLQLMQKSRSAIIGQKISTLLPIDRETINIEGKEWRILRTHMDDGTRYFQLEEAHGVSVTVPTQTSEDGIVDQSTSLFNRRYAVKRIEEELYRVYRYKRILSAALLRVDFVESGASQGLSHQQEDDIFNSYCRFVRESTRETDILCLVGPRDILVTMPETSLDGANDVVSKLLDHTAGGSMEIRYGTAFFNASSEQADFDRLMEKLDDALKN